MGDVDRRPLLWPRRQQRAVARQLREPAEPTRKLSLARSAQPYADARPAAAGAASGRKRRTLGLGQKRRRAAARIRRGRGLSGIVLGHPRLASKVSWFGV